MRVFRYYPPSPEEQRSFFVLFAGSLLAILVAGGLAFFTSEAGIRALMLGAGAAILWRFFAAAREFERRGQRAKVAQIGLDDTGLHLTDANGNLQTVPWTEISDVGTSGGRLQIHWQNGNFIVGAREVENGMELTREILRRVGKPDKPSNFIPLDPR